jgi:D-alanyl-D-alanine endopeptidase (penicillin-binding protein 7)
MRLFARCVLAIALVVSSYTSVDAKTTRPVKKPAVAAPILPRTKIDVLGHLIPDIHASAAVVVNPETDEVLWEQDADVSRSIASITKIMTAEVVQENDIDPDTLVTITPADVRNASHTFLRAQDRITVRDLLHLMLVASDNVAARALARTSPQGAVGFVERMNDKAFEMGLFQTTYVDPSGLLVGNVSTARDMARLLMYVLEDDELTEIMQEPVHTVRIGKRLVSAPSTDRLLGKLNIVAAKTGFINQSGFCIATVVRLESGRNIVIVVLGARTNADRFLEVQNIYKWVELQRVTEVPTACGPYPDEVSPQGKAFIKWHEGFWSRAYRDSGGYAIGYGMHSWKGKRVTATYPKLVTVAEADEEFDRQLRVYQDIVEANVCGTLNQSAYDALVSVAWNLGRVNTVIIAKYAQQGILSVQDFTSTATVHNRPNWSLQARRIREFLFFSGDYNAAMDTHVRNAHDVQRLLYGVRFLRIDISLMN